MTSHNTIYELLANETRDIAAAAALGHALSEAQQTPHVAPGLKDGRPFIILKGEVVYVDETLAKPPRIYGTVKLNDAASFIAAWKKHSGIGSNVYASINPAMFTAVYNDHGALDAGFRDHRSQYTLKHSKQWDTWMNRNGSQKGFDGNEEFAYFVENNAKDFVQPAGGRMLEIATSFLASNNVQYRNIVRLADGNVDLGFSEVVEGNATVTEGGAPKKVRVPQDFTISIPVWEGINAPRYEIEARFRFRILGGGKLKIWYDLVDTVDVIEKSFMEIYEKIKAETGTILLGSAD